MGVKGIPGECTRERRGDESDPDDSGVFRRSQHARRVSTRSQAWIAQSFPLRPPGPAGDEVCGAGFATIGTDTDRNSGGFRDTSGDKRDDKRNGCGTGFSAVVAGLGVSDGEVGAEIAVASGRTICSIADLSAVGTEW